MDLSARLLRYVDNRLCLADPSWDYEICFANFLHPEFYGQPIILETEPDQEFLGFCIEFEPFALRYSPHVTSTRSWHHSLHHLWRCNYQASSHDSFWSPNVRTLPRNGLEVLPHCIVCTEQQGFANPI